MSVRVKRLLGFAPSSSADVASYLLYWAKSKNDDGSDVVLNNDPAAGDVTASVDVGIPPTQTVDGEELLVVALDTIPQIQALGEGEYDFGVAAKDAIGNISDITEAEDVSVDVTPPDAPAKVVVVSAP